MYTNLCILYVNIRHQGININININNNNGPGSGGGGGGSLTPGQGRCGVMGGQPGSTAITTSQVNF